MSGTREVFLAMPGGMWTATVPDDLVAIGFGVPCFICGDASRVTAIDYSSSVFRCENGAEHPLPPRFMSAGSSDGSNGARVGDPIVLVRSRFGEVTERIPGTVVPEPAQ